MPKTPRSFNFIMELSNSLVLKSVDVETIQIYQKTGVNIGFVRGFSNFRFQSQCFRQYFQRRNSSNMASIVDHCGPNALGLTVELAMIIFDILNIPRSKVSLTVVSHGGFGKHVDGAWMGVIGGIINGSFDTSFPEFTPLEARLNVVDFSHAVLGSRANFMTR